MKKISVFDTTISDYNLGNEIIMESIYKNLREIFSNDFFFKLPYMEITSHTVDYIKNSDLIFFGGTNALTSRMEKYKQWGLSLRNFNKIKDVVLMGLGWWQYQEEKTSFYTKILLSHSLSKNYLHAVRDGYTERKLKEMGLENVINTGCPTLWDLTENHCSLVPEKKANCVVTTLTDYKPDKESDSEFLRFLDLNYQHIYFWLQGSGDFDYLNSLKVNLNKLSIVPPVLEKFTQLLKDKEIDYVGTRLHAGIKAIQLKKRSFIISVDNRAKEMGKDFNLPVIDRGDLNALSSLVNGIYKLKIRINQENILRWKKQFIEQ